MREPARRAARARRPAAVARCPVDDLSSVRSRSANGPRLGATSAAISSASIANVPEPHIGSSSAPPSAAIFGQPARSSSAAARFSFSGAGPCTRRYPRRCRLSPDRSIDDRRAIVVEVNVDAHVRRVEIDVGSRAGRVANLIDDRVFDALRAVQAVIDLRMRRREVDRDRTVRDRDARASSCAACRSTTRPVPARRTNRSAAGCGSRRGSTDTRDTRIRGCR